MVYKILPYCIFRNLFGDRKQFGLIIQKNDPDFKEWTKNYEKFYNDSQKGSIGKIVNHYGFKVVEKLDYTNKSVVELGPGIIEHPIYNKTIPKRYTLVDINEIFLKKSKVILTENSCPNVSTIQVKDSTSIPVEDNLADIVLSFHQLEHIYNIEDYLQEIKRVLKKDGLFAGAVPTEGSLAWGGGRYLTSRRYVKKNMNFNFDKIICWEHPNFVDLIQEKLNKNFQLIYSIKKPLKFLPLDFNLSWSFIYKNTDK